MSRVLTCSFIVWFAIACVPPVKPKRPERPDKIHQKDDSELPKQNTPLPGPKPLPSPLSPASAAG